jgi:hypothetical protein
MNTRVPTTPRAPWAREHRLNPIGFRKGRCLCSEESGFGIYQQAIDYWIDAWQRAVLRRGEHIGARELPVTLATTR